MRSYLKRIIKEELNKYLKETNIPNKYLMLIWDTNSDTKYPDLMMAYTADNENKLHIEKGRIADKIEKDLNIKIDVDDFDYEILSYEDFMDEYGSPKNPHKITLDHNKLFEF
jgi:hypothetical protein